MLRVCGLPLGSLTVLQQSRLFPPSSNQAAPCTREKQRHRGAPSYKPSQGRLRRMPTASPTTHSGGEAKSPTTSPSPNFVSRAPHSSPTSGHLEMQTGTSPPFASQGGNPGHRVQRSLPQDGSRGWPNPLAPGSKPLGGRCALRQPCGITARPGAHERLMQQSNVSASSKCCLRLSGWD